MVDISICMVSFNCWSVLEGCLESLYKSDPSVTFEVIMVDNQSKDGTVANTRRLFPQVQIIENDWNAGFTVATNQGIRASKGRYLLWLNTDTILRSDSLRKLMEFLDKTPSAGIVGPKVLNPDGSFQWQCRRGLPTPSAALAYMLRLHTLMPSSRAVGQYLLTYLPVEQANPIDAVSGCCLLARREVWDQIGPLDEEIFAYGEDIDWCVRAKKAGWEVWYYPESEIVHLKGMGGTKSKPFLKIKGIHQAMWIFYRKHLMQQRSVLTTGAVAVGVAGSYLASCALQWLRLRLALRQ